MNNGKTCDEKCKNNCIKTYLFLSPRKTTAFNTTNNRLFLTKNIFKTILFNNTNNNNKYNYLLKL